MINEEYKAMLGGITLSEAPIYVVIQTCLTPAPKERAFFLCIYTSSFKSPRSISNDLVYMK